MMTLIRTVITQIIEMMRRIRMTDETSVLRTNIILKIGETGEYQFAKNAYWCSVSSPVKIKGRGWETLIQHPVYSNRHPSNTPAPQQEGNRGEWRSRVAATIILFALLNTSAFSETIIHGKAGTVGGLLLEIGVGAKPIALGEAFTSGYGVADVNYWNPGAMSVIERSHITFTHIEWLMSMRIEHLSGILSFGKFGSVGVNIEMMNYGAERRTLENDEGFFVGTEESFTSKDVVAGMSYGYTIRNKMAGTFGFGAGGNFILSDYDGAQANAFGGNIGLFYRTPGKNFAIGATFRNIGNKLKYIDGVSPLPFNARIGASCRLLEDWFIIYSDVKIPIYNQPSIHAGLEMNLFDCISFRAGYKYLWGGNPLGWQSGVSVGMGFRLEDDIRNIGAMVIDYAFVPYGELGMTHRASLSFDIGRKGKEGDVIEEKY